MNGTCSVMVLSIFCKAPSVAISAIGRSRTASSTRWSDWSMVLTAASVWAASALTRLRAVCSALSSDS